MGDANYLLILLEYDSSFSWLFSSKCSNEDLPAQDIIDCLATSNVPCGGKSYRQAQFGNETIQLVEKKHLNFSSFHFVIRFLKRWRRSWAIGQRDSSLFSIGYLRTSQDSQAVAGLLASHTEGTQPVAFSPAEQHSSDNVNDRASALPFNQYGP